MRGSLILILFELAISFAFQSNNWAHKSHVCQRRSAPSPRFLFGGAESKPKPVENKLTSAEIEEEMRMAMEYRNKMQEKLAAMRLEGSSGGVTVVYSGEMAPLNVVVSKEAMAGGAAKIADAFVAAVKLGQAEAQKTMQATMMDMQKELMADIQRQEKDKKK